MSTTTAAAAAKMQPSVTHVLWSVCLLDITAGMLTRPAGHEDEAEAQKFFRGRGHSV